MYCRLCHVWPKTGSSLLLRGEAMQWDEENLLNQLLNYDFIIFNRELLNHNCLISLLQLKVIFNEYCFHLLIE